MIQIMSQFSYHQPREHISEYSEVSAWNSARRSDRARVIYGASIALLVLLSYFLGAFKLLPHDPEGMDLSNMMAGPLTEGYLLGTDYMGRDLLTRIILGIQAYFLPGLLSIFIALVFGSILGVAAGYRGGRVDAAVSYFTNLIDALPRLVLMLLVIAAFKPNIYTIMVVVGITTAPTVAMLVKGKILMLKQRNFIESAVALGLSPGAIVFKHILWTNCRALLLIQATIGMAEAVLVETSLSYLGFGVQEPTPSWGNMIQAGANYLLQGQFWASSVPALAILVTVLGFHLLGDGLNNIFEGKRR
jgi:peptide/nickel transport system permease protein